MTKRPPEMFAVRRKPPLTTDNAAVLLPDLVWRCDFTSWRRRRGRRRPGRSQSTARSSMWLTTLALQRWQRPLDKRQRGETTTLNFCFRAQSLTKPHEKVDWESWRSKFTHILVMYVFWLDVRVILWVKQWMAKWKRRFANHLCCHDFPSAHHPRVACAVVLLCCCLLLCAWLLCRRSRRFQPDTLLQQWHTSQFPVRLTNC